MANFSQAFGYIVYIVPMFSNQVDLTELDLTPLGPGGFIDTTGLLANTVDIASFGVGSAFKMGSGTGTAVATTQGGRAGTLATLTFASVTATIGQIVEVSGFTSTFAPLNGTFLVTAQTGTTIQYNTPTTGTITSGAAVGQVRLYTPFVLDGTDAPLRFYGLTDSSLDTTTKEEEVLTYDEETKGYDQSVATGKGASMKFSGLSDFYDPAYKVARIAEQEAVASGILCKMARIGPTGSNEVTYGFGRLINFSEKNPAGTIVKWDKSFKFYGPYRTKLARR
jgi:hypothetical protein